MGNPTLTPLVEAWHDGGFLVSEANGRRSRDPITLKSGAAYLAGTVLGQVTLGAVTVAAAGAGTAGANTGTGTLTADATTPVLANALPGIYTVTCKIAATDAGTFEVADPRGVVRGEVVSSTSGVTFADRIKFVLQTVHGHDFIVGDAFKLTVAAGSGQYAAFDPTALDGTQNPAAILFGAVDATSAAKAATGIVRSAEINASELVWGANVTTTPQKTAAYTALAALGIVNR